MATIPRTGVGRAAIYAAPRDVRSFASALGSIGSRRSPPHSGQTYTASTCMGAVWSECSVRRLIRTDPSCRGQVGESFVPTIPP